MALNRSLEDKSCQQVQFYNVERLLQKNAQNSLMLNSVLGSRGSVLPLPQSLTLCGREPSVVTLMDTSHHGSGAGFKVDSGETDPRAKGACTTQTQLACRYG